MCEQREGKCRKSHGEGQEKQGRWESLQINGDAESKDLGGMLVFSIQLVSQQLFSRSNGLSIDLNTVSEIKAKDREKGL